MRYPNTIRMPHAPIVEDIRESPEAESVSWNLLSETHKDIIMVYDLAVRFVLTPTPISVSTFEKALRINHNLPRHLIQRFLTWVATVPTKRIIYYDELTPRIGLKVDENLTHKAPEGSFCPFLPHKR